MFSPMRRSILCLASMRFDIASSVLRFYEETRPPLSGEAPNRQVECRSVGSDHGCETPRGLVHARPAVSRSKSPGCQIETAGATVAGSNPKFASATRRWADGFRPDVK